MSTLFITILAILAVLNLPWFIGVPLAVAGLAYVAWPRFEKNPPPPEAAHTGL